MGVFEFGNSHQIQIQEGSTDLNGHLVTDKGYLSNAEGDIVNLEGEVIFKKSEIRHGEFPKIFKFSSLSYLPICGNFKRDPNGRPILKEQPDGSLIDDNGALCNLKGLLVDEEGNIVDKNKNLLFEKHLL